MKILLIMAALLSFSSSKIIVDFNTKSEPGKWKIVNDVVMGGKSSSKFFINNNGHAEFSGEISLDNYGGFASVRSEFNDISTKKHSKIRLKIKGDGKDYQIRIKTNQKEYFSYISKFSTSGKWQEIDITLNEMYPSFRGREIDKPNFSNQSFKELTFLIGNKKNEKFKLLIDKIELI